MKRNLANPRDVHWRTDDDGYEYIMRTAHEMVGVTNLGEAERRLWFKGRWRERLESLRAKHRAEGLKDETFWHRAKPR